MLVWLLLTLAVSAYLPSRMLILYDGPEIASKDLQSILTGSRVAPRSMRMDEPKFKMPRLVVDGIPQYSHIVIIGRGDFLTVTNYNDLFQYVEGTLDPHSSRLTEDERMVLPTSPDAPWTTKMAHPTEYLYQKVFEPIPGASIAIFTDVHASQRLLNLLKLLGMKSSKVSGTETGVLKLNTTLRERIERGEISGCDVIGNVSYRPMKQPISDVLMFSPNFRSEAQDVHSIFTFESPSREFATGVVWQGLESNVRVVAVGFLGALVDITMMTSGAKSSWEYFKEKNTREDTQLDMYEYTTLPTDSIQALHQLSQWFGFSKCMLRVSLFQATPVRNTTGCNNTNPSDPDSNYGNVQSVEGNLIHYVVKIEELINNTLWRPYKPKRALRTLQQLVVDNEKRYPGTPGLFPSESLQIKKQIQALNSGLYEQCLQAARSDFVNSRVNKTATTATSAPIYTDLQLHESIMGTLFSMSLAVLSEKEGLFDLIVVPDLVRSYHPRLDYMVPGYNRIKLMHHLHVNMDRSDAYKKVYADWPLFAGLVTTLVLAVYASIVLIAHSDTKREDKEE